MSRSRLVGNAMARSIGERKLAEILVAAGDLVGALETYLAVLEHAMEFGVRLPVAPTCGSIAVDLAATGYHDVAATCSERSSHRWVLTKAPPSCGAKPQSEAAACHGHDERRRRPGPGDGRRSTAAFVAVQLTRIIAELNGG